MGKLDDLIAIRNAINVNDELEQRIKRYYENESSLDAKQKEELNELGGIEFLQSQYEQQDAKLDEMFESIGVGSKYEFEDEKRKYLETLVSKEHISTIGEEPEDFFKKLIELYGEKELTNFTFAGEEKEWMPENEDYGIEMSYEDYGIEMSYDYENEDDLYNNYTYRISDFVSGNEDKIIGLVSDTTLREVLLASKLEFMNTNDIGNVDQYIREYANGANEHGHNAVFLDEYGDVDIEDTLACFSNLPISKDKNFYLYLAKYLDEMEVPFETLLDYIEPNMIDDEFGLELAEVSNTKQYEYQDEFSYELPVKQTLLTWLKSKEDELSSLEKEEKTISEAEALIDKQKEGQDKGEK